MPFPFDFAPTFHRYRLGEPAHKGKRSTIFVCSMADLFGKWVPDSWIWDVFEACRSAPQHRYIFLTKNPKRYERMLDRYFPPNMWFGWSQDGPMADKLKFLTHHSVQTFVSIEPLLRPFEQFNILGVDWAIVGAETGNRKDKVTPKKEWVDAIAEACAANGIPLFMKESLRGIMGTDFRQEYPWEV
jgi:protein gp37